MPDSVPSTTAAFSLPELSSLDAAQAAAIFEQGKEAVVFALLTLAKQLADSQAPDVNPATPSAMVPVYQKPPAKKRRKKPGARAGHAGSHRKKPDQIDHRRECRAEKCPDGGGPLNRCNETRVRYVEDIPDTHPEMTEYTIHRDWCGKCKKKIEAPVTNASSTYYMIDRSRGSPALAKFFIAEFKGTLITDFWGSYNAVACADRQLCLVHLLRELEQTRKYKSPGEHWPAFEKKLRRLLGDAIRLWKSRDELDSASLASRRARLDQRLAQMISTDWEEPNAKRLAKRLREYQTGLFTFLNKKGVPFENNHAERSIRPAVILRKNSYGNRSERGADCQSVTMSIFKTLKQRGHDPIRTVIAAVQEYLKSGKLPPLPPKVTSDS